MGFRVVVAGVLGFGYVAGVAGVLVVSYFLVRLCII